MDEARRLYPSNFRGFKVLEEDCETHEVLDRKLRISLEFGLQDAMLQGGYDN